MSSEDGRRIYEELGVKPLINAAGNVTMIGGSRPSARVLEAAAQANRYFVDMEELLKKSGEYIAGAFGAEAAFVTPGCAAAIALGAAACVSGSDPEKIERMPDTTGMKNEVLIQRRQRYKYDRALTIFGAKLVEVGDEQGATSVQLEKAITERTAAIHYFAPGGGEGVLSIEEVIRIGKARGVPVLVDAAAQVFPLELMKRYTGLGADLVCYGAKYFGAYNSTGVLCGRRALMDAAFTHCFIGFESSPRRSLGRPLKVDRQEVIAVVAALRDWLSADHAARLKEHERKGEVILRALEGLPHVTAAWTPDPRSLSSGVRVTLDEKGLGKTAAQVIRALREGTPGIWTRGSGSSFQVATPLLSDGDEQVVAERLREALRR
ncbi:MAG: hypothetical protein A3F84_00520 [Candidatus Handelsmanbacteria bacterium RIFCSPLOWO2_12_FULL_64_10]|uniref:Aminotransferase class V domain-containing protein n=1 Tax=Handelsmanbacteria sp. (strain RIFCSPLOWO2_12_FULL_64_10) TaxID=1817868 RepID=A0A1F6C6V1_HANXR|nr:MAG: hypothetical protein A3F84_00520 [Candidatus Handelsmanbacteria bacterium RIFCSPLOWO2_12_FULL_64_10]